MKKKRLIIFAKNPELGKVKTRIAKTLGNEVALAIYFQLLEHTKAQTKDLEAVEKVVYYSESLEADDLWSSGEFDKRVQKGGDLGERMYNAFKDAFNEGCESVCIIGSDCQEISQQNIEKAFDQLCNHNAVIGPAQDGGYYLLGMNELSSLFFKGKNWSTDEVFVSTIEDFEREKMTYAELPVLNDVDTEKDLGEWATVFESNYLSD